MAFDYFFEILQFGFLIFNLCWWPDIAKLNKTVALLLNMPLVTKDRPVSKKLSAAEQLF